MTENNQKQLGKILWNIADALRTNKRGLVQQLFPSPEVS
jgi:hypothetical protein